MMATEARTLYPNGQQIHIEHLILERLLYKLEAALDGLTCHSEVATDLLSTADDARRYLRKLAEGLPGHCRREEILLLDPAAEISPELAEFCRHMKTEHISLKAQVAAFQEGLDDFARSEERHGLIGRLKDQGKDLMAALRQHVAKEEEQLSGFL